MSLAHSKKIVTDGLDIYFDAANPKSYISGSNTIYNLIPGSSTTNASLVNGVTYSTDNAGQLEFDGTNQYLTLDASYTIDTNYTLRWVVRSYQTASNARYLRLFDGSGDTWFKYEYRARILSRINGVTYQFISDIGEPRPNLNQEYNDITLTMDSNYTMSYYTNGIKNTDNPCSNTGSIDIETLMYSQGTSTYQCDLISFSAYNKQLTDSEVAQNYNALKRRYR